MSDYRLYRLIPLLFLILVLSGGCATSAFVPASEAAVAYYNLGNAYNELGRHQEAVAAFVKALELDPGLVRAGFNLARVYIILERYDKSLDELDLLLEKDSENRNVLEAKAWVFHLKGDDTQALKIYDDVLEKSPGSSNSLYNSALLLADQDDFQNSIDRYKNYHSLYPEDTDVIFQVARLNSELGKDKEAYEWIEKYLVSEPEDLSALELAGDILSNRKLYADAVKTYRKITDTDHDEKKDGGAQALSDLRGRVYFKTAEILLKYMEDFDRGIKALQNSIDTGWQNQDYYDGLLSEEDAVWYGDVFALIGEGGSAGADEPEPAVD